MTAGTPTRHLATRGGAATKYFDHASAPRVNTDIIVVEALRREYPQLHLTVVPQFNCNILGFAAAGNAAAAPIDSEQDRLSTRTYSAPPSRLDESREYVIFVAEGRDGTGPYPVLNQYVLSPSVEATNNLLLEVGAWSSQLHNEVWVFDGGRWQKSAELWQSVQNSHWEDVILDESMKKTLIDDVANFFDSRDAYARLKVPWKRGLIYYGPPGNGKTISIKATMNSLYARERPVPTLYVRTLASYGGPEYSLNQIFQLARREAPCLLVFEDLDSIVNDRVRSYFLNEVDGIRKNDGILMIGSTNHLERLDPGISKRPSRFDRKYLFPNPNEEQRAAYMKYWQGKLADNKDLEFPDKLCPAIAKITPKFSFAYLQEAMVATLLAIARHGQGKVATRTTCVGCSHIHEKTAPGAVCNVEPVEVFTELYYFALRVRAVDNDDPDLDNYVLWREIKRQVRILKEMMGADDGTESEH
ncbi:P-loop containing nucleoside triphosphate hydrolase protein [Dissoconium aciculare CBS 342.82]|uniref:P-loop containing nucleoside triphosphate hydrolase protein n=1 Tax=Dissoconium aciculare CBS 342.82 TaxID=1314786 RepID=A0A6J3MIZ8_9PEZI|nr:P-loop containing nucleoside triphosphate hydrolase protein [Dissoconium aciculare CBS 342.82]KAF1827891.1 P-loop containing nucleoside triphosphate hydrolase protein [Dissoconium aciculare CBS 342.82]